MESVNHTFVELEARVREYGLLQPDTAFYLRRVAFSMTLIAVSIAIIATVENFWLHMANAVLLAFAFGQLSLFFHDVGHGQVTGSRYHSLMGAWFSVMLGWNHDWWIQKHDRHHAFPNQPGFDPDVGIRFLAFSEDQARGKKGWYRAIARRQHVLFIPMLLGEAWHLRCASITYLLRQGALRSMIGLVLIALHLALYAAILLYFLPLGYAAAFAAVHWGLLGVYLGLVFAPNHKGMPMPEHGTVQRYMEQQVLTSRNVRGGWLIDMIYGGLNYQIEHHLFPSMPRSHLKDAAVIAEAFCREKGISYRAVRVGESFGQIFGHLARVGRAAN